MTTLGHARIDDFRNIADGVAGDNSGKEVTITPYYVNPKGWRVLRAKDTDIANNIATAMQKACENNNIGYDQKQRNSLYNLIAGKGFDPSQANQACETDCSALIRVCILYALNVKGLDISIKDFITSNEADVLLKAKLFSEMIGDEYTSQSKFLKRGDILVTKIKGHTSVVIEDEGSTVKKKTKKYILGDRVLKNGLEGDDVKQLQINLIQLGYDCGKWGADGFFGGDTQKALVKFQKDVKFEGTLGEYDLNTHQALLKKL